MADTDISKMKVADLKRELKVRGLPITGNKIELIERLQTSILEGDNILDDTAITDELLGDDVLDDDIDDDTKSLLDSNHEDAMLKTPPEDAKSTELPILDAVTTQKKVILKRRLLASLSSGSDTPTTTTTTSNEQNIINSHPPPIKLIKTMSSSTGESIPNITTESIDNAINNNNNNNNGLMGIEINVRNSSSSSSSTKITTDAAATDNNVSDEKKLVKLSTLSIKERLEMRSKKFGASALPPDVQKLARAERFGLTNNNNNNAKDNDQSTVGLDVLKKRAERFGGSVSKEMNSIENQEKLQKRQERFGAGGAAVAAPAVAATTTTTTTTTAANATTTADNAAVTDPVVVAAAAATSTATAAAADVNKPKTNDVVKKTITMNDMSEKARQRLERFKTIPPVK